MADLPQQLFPQLRRIIGEYLVNVILEESAAGIARLIREGLEHREKLAAKDHAKVMQVVRRLE